MSVSWYRVERDDFGMQIVEDHSGALVVAPLRTSGIVASRFATHQVLIFTPFGDEDYGVIPSPKGQVVYDKAQGFQPYIKKQMFF